MEPIAQATNVIEMEENPSSRYHEYYQDIQFHGRKITLAVDTLILCDYCKVPMTVVTIQADRSLDDYQYPNASPWNRHSQNSSLHIEVELSCPKCLAKKTAIAQDMEIVCGKKDDTDQIRIIKLEQTGGIAHGSLGSL